MQGQLDAYCTHLRSERQVSPHTLEAYRRDLNKVLVFCAQASIASWAALDIQRLRQLVSRLHQQGQSSRSIARLLSAVRGLYHYLNREGLCDHDPANGLAPPKGERRLPKTLDTDRALQLLEGGVEDDFLALRDHAILELFYSTGLVFNAFLADRETAELREQELRSDGVDPQPSAQAYALISADIRQRGLHFVHGLLMPGVDALSAPVFDATGQLAGVLTVLGPTSLFHADENGPAAKRLLAASQAISWRMGYQPA